MRSSLLTLPIAAVLVAAAACSSSPAPAPAATAAPSENLAFSGPLAGTLTTGIEPLQFSNAQPPHSDDGTVTHTACASFDVKDDTGMDWGNTYEIAIYGMVNGHATSLVLTLDSEIKPSGTVPITGKANQGATASLNAAGSTIGSIFDIASDNESSVTFDSGSRSGSIHLYETDRPSGTTVESVTGAWRCP